MMRTYIKRRRWSVTEAISGLERYRVRKKAQAAVNGPAGGQARRVECSAIPCEESTKKCTAANIGHGHD